MGGQPMSRGGQGHRAADRGWPLPCRAFGREHVSRAVRRLRFALEGAGGGSSGHQTGPMEQRAGTR